MQWTIDPASPDPLFAQVAQSVRAALASGAVSPGDRLPSAKTVAELLDINLHTVLRAYQLLRDEGVIELRRGRGAIVLSPSDHHGFAANIAQEAQRRGLTLDDLTSLLKGRLP